MEKQWGRGRCRYGTRARRPKAQACDVLSIGAEEKKDMATVLGSLAGNPTLTVGEADHFAADGGMIGSCLEENKVRFEINKVAAERANRRISARLLALAKAVVGRAKGD